MRKINTSELLLWISFVWVTIESIVDFFLSDYYAEALSNLNFMGEVTPEIYAITAAIGLIFAIILGVTLFLMHKHGESSRYYIGFGVLGVLAFLFSGVVGYILTVIGAFIGVFQLSKSRSSGSKKNRIKRKHQKDQSKHI